MLIRLLLVLLFICSVFIISVQSQTQKPNKKNKLQTTRKLNKEKPSVFLEFSKFDVITSKRLGESRKIVWMKLHNNLNTGLSLCYYDLTEKAGERIGLHYEVEKRPQPRISIYPNRTQEPTVIPDGYPIFDFCDTVKVKSGKSLEFPIPEDHFVKNTRIKIMFFYDWEDAYEAITGFEPLHYVYFYSDDLRKIK